MLRRIGAVVAGLLAGVVIVTVNELICSKIYPLPPGTVTLSDEYSLPIFIAMSWLSSG